MRLFTAIDIPDTLRDTLTELQDTDVLAARWSDPDQFHVTLRFIGDVSQAQAIRYEEALADVYADPVRCEPYGLDLLPSRQSPRVLMLGLERTDSMMELYEAVSDVLESRQPSGLDPEDRKYRPHVTIGRLEDVKPNEVHEFLRVHEETTFPAFEAERFVLYESTLRPDGAIHEPEAFYPLSS